jgi:hypothetical protein
MNRIKSAKKQTIDGVLFLQGVFKTDCDRVEDFFHERLLNGSYHESKIYDKIPLTFTNLNDWPKSTNLLCWNCRRSVKGRPWFEPQSIDPMARGKSGEFISSENLNRSGKKTAEYCINAKGCFCSPNCVMRHIITFSRDLADRLNKIAMLLFVYEIFTGVKINDIHPSPLVTELEIYGGVLTEQDYQKIIEDANSAIAKQESMEFVNNCKSFFSRLSMDD